MKIGCLCVTEGRAEIFGIALESFLSQGTVEARPWRLVKGAVLYITLPGEKGATFDNNLAFKAVSAPYWEVHQRLTASFATACFLPLSSGADSVQDRLDSACAEAFGPRGGSCDLVTMWDDDDYRPPGSLASFAKLPQFHLDPARPVVASYNAGFFVELTTLKGGYVMPGHLWGGCLTFNRAAFEAANGFAGRRCPGYDRSFVEDVRKAGGLVVELGTPEPSKLPMAFIHGKNCATLALPNGAKPMEDDLRKWMPESVFAEVKRAQGFLLSRRVAPGT